MKTIIGALAFRDASLEELCAGKVRVLQRGLRLRFDQRHALSAKGLRLLDSVIVSTYRDCVSLDDAERAHVIVSTWRHAFWWAEDQERNQRCNQ